MKFWTKTPIQYVVILIILMICAVSSGVFAQTKEITGIIYDAKSGEPLPFATIGFLKVNIGTVSDSEGKFTLRFDEQHLNDQIT
ncbi:MAG: carboxypeptidase-like regulatory domain-containing protein, partial [Bacteroidota bacterium]